MQHKAAYFMDPPDRRLRSQRSFLPCHTVAKDSDFPCTAENQVISPGLV